jgi:hypothetical protein
VQILGSEELTWLDGLDSRQRWETIAKIVGFAPLALVISKDQTCPEDLRLAAEEFGTPLWTSPKRGHELLNHLQYHLARTLAPRVTLHGVGVSRADAGATSVHLDAEQYAAQRERIGGVAQGSAEAGIGKALRDLRQQLKVLLGELFRRRHREHQVDGHAVGGAEIDRGLEAQERRTRTAHAGDPPMRDGHAMADGGAAHAFALAQATGDRRAVRAGAGQQARGGVEDTIAAAGIGDDNDAIGREDFG